MTSSWMSSENYKYVESLEPKYLAWEFLRRNQGYVDL